jgi:hypothetical protein
MKELNWLGELIWNARHNAASDTDVDAGDQEPFDIAFNNIMELPEVNMGGNSYGGSENLSRPRKRACRSRCYMMQLLLMA